MNFLKSFKERIFSLTEDDFEIFALELFQYQSQKNPVYRSFLQKLGVAPKSVDHTDKIPFLPIDFFKHHRVTTGDWREQYIFKSSGTTGQVESKNYVEDPEFYKKISKNIFEKWYGPIENYDVLALLPSYLERGNSSLVYMVDGFIKAGNSDYSGFYLSNYGELAGKLNDLTKIGNKVLLIGVSYALLDLVENFRFDAGNGDFIVMETGGMKGRRKEMIRRELHDMLSQGFRQEVIHSEYGMTELTSQAYAFEGGKFHTPSWMRIKIRDVNDPFSFLPPGYTGGINIVDLANIATCSFIETKDLGRKNPDQTFEVLGRFDNSEIRGCNLMVG